MAESEYKVLKTRIEELIENIESIDKEAASFSAAKAELLEISGNLHDISSDLAKVIKTSEAVLDQVESIAVTSTLQSMKESAEMYAETSENLLGNAKATYDKQTSYFQGKVDSLSEQYQKTVQQSDDNFVEARDILLSQSKAVYADYAQEIQNRIDSLTADFNKKLLIMGGIAIASSIVALICSFI